MSVGLVTETKLLDFRPAMDPEDKSRAVDASRLANLGSIVKLKSDGFLSKYVRALDSHDQSNRGIWQTPGGHDHFFEGDMARGVYITDGKTRILKTALPGDVLGLNSAFAGRSHKVTVKTIHSCQLAFIARHDGDHLTTMYIQADSVEYAVTAK